MLSILPGALHRRLKILASSGIMRGYILQRLILLPLTLFAIVFVNFVIINLAPGEPVYLIQSGVQGEASQQAKGALGGPEDRYLQFRHFFGLTLPLLYNNWPLT